MFELSVPAVTVTCQAPKAASRGTVTTVGSLPTGKLTSGTDSPALVADQNVSESVPGGTAEELTATTKFVPETNPGMVMLGGEGVSANAASTGAGVGRDGGEAGCVEGNAARSSATE